MPSNDRRWMRTREAGTRLDCQATLRRRIADRKRATQHRPPGARGFWSRKPDRQRDLPPAIARKENGPPARS
jgi:hypothetical protein